MINMKGKEFAIMNTKGKTIAHGFRRILVMVLLIYAGSILLIGLKENSYLYYPTQYPDTWTNPPGDVTFQDVFFTIPSGSKIHGWWFPGSHDGPVILFLHGNAGHLAMRYSLIQFLMKCHPQPGGILIVDYPGYGKSSGKPSEKALFETGENACRYLKATLGISSDRIVIFGRSLGGAVALHTAIADQCAGLVMECSFLSVARMAQEYYPYLPGLKLLNRQKFDNESMIKNVGVPILMIHGDRDQIIPVEQGRKLYRIAPEPKTYVEIKKANHDNVYLIDKNTYQKAWNKFLKDVRNKTQE